MSFRQAVVPLPEKVSWGPVQFVFWKRKNSQDGGWPLPFCRGRLTVGIAVVLAPKRPKRASRVMAFIFCELVWSGRAADVAPESASRAVSPFFSQ